MGAILIGSGSGALTIGSIANAGTLTAGTGTGTEELILNSNTASTTTKHWSSTPRSKDNGTGVLTLIKTGPGGITLAGTSTRAEP